jgi:hypothetical protein
MANQPLEQRAGLNVGNQPGFLTFIQQAGCKSFVIPTNDTKVVILEGIEQGHRSIYTQVEGSSSAIFNPKAVSYDWNLWFEDDEGNQMIVGAGTVVSAVPPAVTADVISSGTLDESLFALAPGEKFLLAAHVTPVP